MASRRRTDPLHLLLLALAALFVVYPLIAHSCSCGHDFDFHLESWLDAAQQLRHGDLHPRWDFSAAWNAGEPRFLFYPPLSWYLGAGIGLLLSHLPGIGAAAAWSATPIIFTWAALTLSGVAMYRVARDYALPGSALAAGTFYLANPYMLFTAYERTAYAELLAAVWIPLLLHAILRPRISIPRLAIPVALLWLTNAPAAVLCSYAVALLAFVRVATSAFRHWNAAARPLPATTRIVWPPRALLRLAEPLNLALTTIAGASLGLLAAAFYIVPAAWERRFVQIHMALVPGLRIQDNFLFHHTAGPDAALHDQVLHTASVIAVLLWSTAAVLLLVNHLLCRRTGRVAMPAASLRALPVKLLAVLTFAVGFALTPWSAPLWRHAPEAAFLQFPWRAVSLLAAVAALALAELLTRAPTGRPYAGVVAGAAALSCLPCYQVFRQGCDPQDTPDARLSAFVTAHGSEPTDEYTPIAADNDALGQHDPSYWIASDPNAAPPAQARAGEAPSRVTLRLPHAADLILNLRAYPGWTILLDGAIDLQRLPRPDGLIALPLPAGSSTVELAYTRLPDEKIGDLLTLLGLGLLAASALPLRWRREAPLLGPPAQPAATLSGVSGTNADSSGENPNSSPDPISKYHP